MKRKPTVIELGKRVDDPDTILVKLGSIIRTIHALQAEADYLCNRIIQGLVAEGSLMPKDMAWARELSRRGEHRAAAEYLRGRLA